MSALPVSVCIVSWHRPEALKRCLLGVSQLQHENFEVVVVADDAALKALGDRPDIKTVTAPEANISKARNLGIAASAGEVVAFIDDDAVPEPTWLSFLTAPFADKAVSAATGYVRGRNGISFQWRGRRVNRLGETQVHAPGNDLPPGWALKTEGTNMAIRRSALVELGGFDETYRFFLDETDLNIRLADAGHVTVLAPEAEVHHGFLPSGRRRGDRVPLSLVEIGESWAHFLALHAPSDLIGRRRTEIISQENERLIRHLVTGGLEPRDVRRLRAELFSAINAPASGLRKPASIDLQTPADYLKFPSQKRPSVVLSCRPATLRRARRQAEIRADSGEIVTLFNLTLSTLYHYQTFTQAGVWEQHGGLFGKSDREQPLFKVWKRKQRIDSETKRIAYARKVNI